MAIGKSDSVHYQNIADSIRRNLSGAEGGGAVYFPAEMAGGVDAVAEHNYQKGYTDGGGGAVSNGERFIKTVYGIEKNVSVNEAVDQAISDFNAIKFELGNRGAVVSDIEPTENYPGKIVEVYDKGAEAGYSSGKEAGITEGFETGKQAGIAEGYNTGKAEGYNSGYQIGKVDGKNEGYTEGVESGKAEVKAEVKPMLLDILASQGLLLVRPVDENSSIEEISFEIKDGAERKRYNATTHIMTDIFSSSLFYENQFTKRVKATSTDFVMEYEAGYANPYLLELIGGVPEFMYTESAILELYDPDGTVTNDVLVNDTATVTVHNLYSRNSGASKLVTDNDGFVWYVDDEELYLCDYIGKARDISLPASYGGREYTFWSKALNALRIDSLYIPKEKKTFQGNGFAYNPFGNDIDVVIDDISEWFEKTFNNFNQNPLGMQTCYLRCNGERVTNIIVPEGVTEIGKYQFYFYKSLQKTTLSQSVTSIGAHAFDQCSGLTEIVLPSGLTSIGANAFDYCSGLMEIVLPSDLTSIGAYAFRYCRGLTEIVLPTNLTSIGAYAFDSCSSLERFVHYGNTLSSSMCAYCSSLTDLIINGNVTTVGSSAFSNCTKLTNVTVNGSIKVTNSNLRFSSSSNLTVESMVSIMNGLVSNVGGTQYTVYFGSTNLNKLTAEQKAIATNKNIKLA